MRRFAGIEQVALRGVADRPVHMLAGAVDAGKRLFMQQADKAMLLGGAFHQRHHQLLVIGGDIGALEIRGDFKLRWRHLVVVCFGGNAQLVQLILEILHEHLHARGNRTEVMIVKLLSLRRRRAEQRAARQQQVGAHIGEQRVDQEVLLLRTAT